MRRPRTQIEKKKVGLSYVASGGDGVGAEHGSK